MQWYICQICNLSNISLTQQFLALLQRIVAMIHLLNLQLAKYIIVKQHCKASLLKQHFLALLQRSVAMIPFPMHQFFPWWENLGEWSYMLHDVTCCCCNDTFSKGEFSLRSHGLKKKLDNEKTLGEKNRKWMMQKPWKI